MPQIEVAFDIDANGIVNVSAKDLGTGKEQRITITASSGLADEEIKRMVKDAEAHATEDKARREMIEDRNRLDTLVYGTQKTFDEHKEKLGAAEKGELEAAFEDGKKALEGEDHGAIKTALDRLTKASHKLAEVMYQKTSAAGSGAAGSGAAGSGAAGSGAAGAGADAGASGGTKPNDDVIDAEYVDVDKSN
jgi:molecular chaperone DnaK